MALLPSLPDKAFGVIERLAKWIAWAAMLYAIFALFINSYYGRADIGDFSRIMVPYASRPVGFAANWPKPDGPLWQERFSNYFLPFWVPWTSEGSVNSNFTSAHLFLMAGKALHGLFGSPGLLEIRFMGAAYVAFTLGVLLFLLLKLVNWKTPHRHRRAAFLLLLFPAMAVLFSDIAYVPLFNTFYQDPAGYVGLLACVVSLCLPILEPERRLRNCLCLCISAMILSTAKVQFFFVGFAAAIPILAEGWRWAKGSWKRTGAGVAAVVLLVSIGLEPFFNKDPKVQATQRNNAFNSFFNGPLRYVDDRAAHLRRLNIPLEAEKLVGLNPYYDESQAFIKEHPDLCSHWNTFNVIFHEPSALFAFIQGTGECFRPLTPQGLLPHLQGFGPGEIAGMGVGLGLWSRGLASFSLGGPWAFWMSLVGLAVTVAFSWWGYRREKRIRPISWMLGFLELLVVCGTLVCILGEGTGDLEKHLQVAVMAFWIWWAALWSLVLETVLDGIHREAPSFPPVDNP